MTAADAHKEAVTRFHDLLSRLDSPDSPLLDEIAALWDEQIVYEQPYPTSGEPVRVEGREELRVFIGGIPTRVDGFRFPRLDVYATDDPEIVIATFSVAGTVIASGREYANECVSVLRFRDGRMARWREYFNPLAVRQAFAL